MGVGRTVGLLITCAALVAATVAQAEVEGAKWTPRATPWDAIGVGSGGRAVEIQFLPDNCGGERNRRAVVEETRTSVKITLDDEIEVYPPDSAPRSCPAPHPISFLVKLGRVLAGRRVYGRAQNRFPIYQRNDSLRAVPRLVGFAPWDAEHALFVLGLGSRPIHMRAKHPTGLPRVLVQVPTSGKIVSSASVVRFAVGR